MPVQPQFLAYVLEQLARLNGLRSNRMFGGIGLYSEGLFFGLIDDDTVFFKTDDSNISRYRKRNMPRFMPFPDRPEAVMGYHQVPVDVIEDADMLVEWARESVAVARAAQSRKVESKPRAAPSKARVKKKAQAKRKTRIKRAKHNKPARRR